MRTGNSIYLRSLQEIARRLEDCRDLLDAGGDHLAAAHVDSAINALRMPDAGTDTEAAVDCSDMDQSH